MRKVVNIYIEINIICKFGWKKIQYEFLDIEICYCFLCLCHCPVVCSGTRYSLYAGDETYLWFVVVFSIIFVFK